MWSTSPGPGREISDEERSGVSFTDTEPEPALGVGESTSRRGEEIAAKEERERVEVGTKGPSERPVGVSTPEESSKVDPAEPIDDESPTMPAGDQGG